jgi:DNA invertase Pin-like site-specific DNA recombinase
MRVIGYTRISSRNREEWQPSRSDQEQRIRGWCKANGHKLVRVEQDEAVSGTNGLKQRDGLQDALAAVRSGEADGLVVRDLERLSRDLMVQEAILAELWSIRPEVEMLSTSSTDQHNCTRDNPDDPSRKFVRHVLGAASAYIRDLTVARLQRGKRAKAERGGFAGGSTPFGWRSQDRELVEDPTEQTTLARIRELHGQGRSLRAIAAVLEAEDHRPRRGQRWHPNTLARILDRP